MIVQTLLIAYFLNVCRIRAFVCRASARIYLRTVSISCFVFDRCCYGRERVVFRISFGIIRVIRHVKRRFFLRKSADLHFFMLHVEGICSDLVLFVNILFSLEIWNTLNIHIECFSSRKIVQFEYGGGVENASGHGISVETSYNRVLNIPNDTCYFLEICGLACSIVVAAWSDCLRTVPVPKLSPHLVKHNNASILNDHHEYCWSLLSCACSSCLRLWCVRVSTVGCRNRYGDSWCNAHVLAFINAHILII